MSRGNGAHQSLPGRGTAAQNLIKGLESYAEETGYNLEQQDRRFRPLGDLPDKNERGDMLRSRCVCFLRLRRKNFEQTVGMP